MHSKNPNYVTLRGAEDEYGVERHTLREWLERDLGLVFPEVVRGSKFLISRGDVMRCIELHQPRAVGDGSAT
ncbi:MAG TPA: hypothetical protein VN788_00020 [Verrucomicrobiae bacterium]|nr:hypothetical protein [Verrucomicrobiae bacterium]